jgi:8-oxo-dGTP pyrophosphatase MutT (NUDIX family)
MSKFTQFINFISKRLEAGLPGRSAHMRMIPKIRLEEFPEYPSEGVRSSVLLLLYPVAGIIYTTLILRPTYNGVHSGQIGLPGGKYEDADADLYQTALREAREEVGIDAEKVSLIGPLSDLFIPPSRFLLTPYLAHTNCRPDFHPDPEEVERIIEVDIFQISDQNLKEKDITLHGGRIIRTPYYDLQGQVVWGATGMILSEFSELMKSY